MRKYLFKLGEVVYTLAVFGTVLSYLFTNGWQ